MKKLILLISFLLITTSLFSQTVWNKVWTMEQVPFQLEDWGSEMSIVKAGFDTDEDGWGEFITGYTDLDSNYVFMYEATGDNTYEMVWYFKFPLSGNSYFGVAVGDADNNGIVDIAIGYPVVVTAENPNPARVFFFTWNGVTGENKYGREQGDGTFRSSSETHFDVPANTDWRPYSMLIEDVDKDGANEVVIGVRAGGRDREVLVASAVGDPSAFGSWEVEYNFQHDENGSNYCTITGDLDNDGLTDIIEIVWERLTLRMFEVTGPDTYEHVNDIEQVYATEEIDFGSVDGAAIVDINGDGKNELLIAGADDASIEK
ncbi:MAG: VCBS repeat-containing protein, partial [Melioribacteraceae bacterium]|nr:VCBS repeat-containing protein [Melioribacteraceae bacterium]